MKYEQEETMSRPDYRKAYPAGVSAEMPPIAFKNLSHMARAVAQARPEKTAFTLCLPNGAAGTLSFGQCDQSSDALAAYLREDLGLQAGDRVALQMPNCLSYPMAAMACFKANLVIVNMNPLYTAPEMSRQLRDSGAKVLIIIDLFGDKVAEAVAGSAVKQVITPRLVEYFPPLKRLIIQGVLKYVKKQVKPCKVPHLSLSQALAAGQRRLKAGVNLDAYVAKQDLESLAALQYTGGTTGVSKGAELTHGNLLANAAQAQRFISNLLLPDQDTVFTALPLYHVFAFTVNFLLFYQMGNDNVMVPSPRPISNLRIPFQRYRFTCLTGVNTLFNALLGEAWFKQSPPKFLKAAVGGGTAVHPSVSQAWAAATGSPIYQGYGLTEASPVVCFNPFSDKAQEGKIGVPFPGTEVACLDENDAEAPLGQPGELCVKGPQVMRGYWQQPGETAQVLVRGWLRTGDIAVMDEAGYFAIVDRKKELINVSGFKVFPNEVEECLGRMPGIVEAGVIGVPDDNSGEAVRAYVVLKPGASVSVADIKAHCKKELVSYKVPHQIYFKTELPKTPVGKILRKDLKAEALAELKA